MDVKEIRERLQVLTATVSRAALAGMIGQSYGGDRDIYSALGYKRTLVFEDYRLRYERQGLAGRVVDAPCDATWRVHPRVTESAGEETDFEKAWDELVKRLQVWSVLKRADKLAGIGQYGILLLGFNDQGDLSAPVERAGELLYSQPYYEADAAVATLVTDRFNPRFGLPETYTLKTGGLQGQAVATINVHWSRVIHIAEGRASSNIYGTPRLKRVYNDLQALELVAYGSSEMFWRGALPGRALILDKEAEVAEEDLDKLKLELDAFEHNLRRWLRLQGMTVQDLAPQVADPSQHVDVFLTLISAATGIPKRILSGSERGELASSQDESNWNVLIDSRRRDYGENVILRPFIDRLIEVGALPSPKEPYAVEWPDIFEPSEKEQAETGRIRTESLGRYVSSPGAETILPPKVFLRKVLKLTDDEIKDIEKSLESEIGDEGEGDEGEDE
ncbi:MAG: phage portal protein [Thermodesulfobacteriota bacterium]